MPSVTQGGEAKHAARYMVVSIYIIIKKFHVRLHSKKKGVLSPIIYIYIHIYTVCYQLKQNGKNKKMESYSGHDYRGRRES